MKIDAQQQLDAIQKRIEEIFMNAKLCKSIDIQVHVDLDGFPEISYTVSEYCMTDEALNHCGMTEKDIYFITKEKNYERA